MSGLFRHWARGCAVWLTRSAGWAGDPSLRLNSGSAQDDKLIVELRRCQPAYVLDEPFGVGYHL